MGDHHAFRTRRRPAGVVKRNQVAFLNIRPRELRRGRRSRRLVIEPAGLAAFKSYEMLHIWKLGADTIDRGEVVGMNAHHARAAVANDVSEVFRR